MNKEESFALSNFEMKVICEGRLHFERAVRIAFGQFSKAVAYCKPEPNEMVLFWHEEGLVSRDSNPVKAEALPFELDADKAIEFLWSWLQTVPRNEMGKEPDDFDGSVSERAYCVEANSVTFDYRILKVTKIWAEYHK